jgi:dipeptidyl aminopeptidase/acylaminoacyl peptidase
MKRLVFAALLLAALPVNAQTSGAIEPNPNLQADGIPPIARSVAQRVGAYSEFRGHAFADWHPQRREMLVTHRAANANVLQLFRLNGPNGSLEPITNFPEPITSGRYDASGRYVIYKRDTGGNEASRVYRMDLATRDSVLLSPDDTRSEYDIDDARKRLLISSVAVDRTAAAGRRDQLTTALKLLDIERPEAARTLPDLPGSNWFGLRFAPDGGSVVVTRFMSIAHTELWKIDLATGARERLLPVDAQAAPAAYYLGGFSRDGQRLFVSTDARGEFQQLAEFRLDRRELRILSADVPWDVKAADVSRDGRRLAAVFNVDGRDELRMYDAASGAALAAPAVPRGQISRMQWHPTRTTELAFTLNSPVNPAGVVSYDTERNAAERWTSADTAGIDPASFQDAEIVRWKSFDGRMISGVLTRPPARFTGPRPVLISIHGGPEGQATVSFNGRWNYVINELGIALLEPNVRGSTGYGKEFSSLDSGVKREDAVRDIGALLDWLKTAPGLDASRVVVMGSSYGGYMVLASLVHYSDRLRGGIDVVGISDFVSFLNNTESYRRDIRRAEYGDERDPAVRAVLDSISPLANASKIRAPLLVVHGRNDPRVPYTEAEQIVAQVRASGTPVWYLLADNEGHGFARKANADFQFYTTVAFLDRYLLAE